MEQTQNNFSTIVEKSDFTVIEGGIETDSGVYLTLKNETETIGDGEPCTTQIIKVALVNLDGTTKTEIIHTFTKAELLAAAQMFQRFAAICE